MLVFLTIIFQTLFIFVVTQSVQLIPSISVTELPFKVRRH